MKIFYKGKQINGYRKETSIAPQTSPIYIPKLIAQYKFDANTYEDLMPEFNPEFTEDMYEVHDNVNEIVIDDIVLEVGAIDGSYGHDIDSDGPEITASVCNRTKYLSIMPNTTYSFNHDHDDRIMFDWYDENKKYITQDYIEYHEYVITAPINAKYLRMWANKTNLNENKSTITAKLVTRSIESKNGDLPTLMKFGITGDSNKSYSLLELLSANVSELVTMNQMFNNCTKMTICNTGDWDTSNVTDMYGMFYCCESLTSLNLTNWQVGNVTDMSSMFSGCELLTSIGDLSNWDVSNVEHMTYYDEEDGWYYGMFDCCSSLVTLGDISNWNTEKITDMSGLFCYCSSLTSLDLSNWNTSNVTTMRDMFCGCESLISLDVSNFNTNNVTNVASMFDGCSSLASLDLSNWDVGNVTDMSYMFYECESLTSIGDLSNWQVGNVTDMCAMFWSCTSLSSLDLSNFDTSNVTSMANMFGYCNKLTSLDVSNFNTSNVTSMLNMFISCNSLTKLDLTSFRLTNCESIKDMFGYCDNLETIIFPNNFCTSGTLTNMQGVFVKCKSLKSLDLSNWNIANVTIMSWMLQECVALTSLNISNWRLNDTIAIQQIFMDSPNIKTIIMNNTDYNSVNKVITQLPTRPTDSIGTLNIEGIDDISQVDITTLNNKYWTIVSHTILNNARLGQTKLN